MNHTVTAQIERLVAEHVHIINAAFGPANCRILEEIAQAICDTFRRGGKLLICGNGGSSADAQHMAAELVGRFTPGVTRPALPAIAITTDSSILTAIGNDMGFDQVFARQVEALARCGDLVLCISTSGTSPNILAAAKAAKACGAKVVALTGPKATPLGELADICLATGPGPVCRIQEAHELAYHIICQLVESGLKMDTEPPTG